MYVPIIIPNAETQIMFYDSNKETFTLSFDSWNSVRKTSDNHLEYQVESGLAQDCSGPVYLVVTHKTADRIGVANKINNIAFFDNPIVRKDHVDIDGIRYPSDGVSIDYASNDYVDQ